MYEKCETGKLGEEGKIIKEEAVVRQEVMKPNLP